MTDAAPFAATVRRFDRDRYLCAQFAAPDRLADLLALHATNIEVARIGERVKEPGLGLIRLQWWRDLVAAAAEGTRPGTPPLAAALADLIQRRGLSATDLDRLLVARQADLHGDPPADLAALTRYAAETGGLLGNLGLDILGVAEPAIRQAARDVGTAWALVGLTRAVPFHAATGRSFLPADLCHSHGVDPAAPGRSAGTDALGRVVAVIAEEARHRLAAARAAVPRPPRAARPVLLPATLADGHLARLARAGHDPYRARPASAGAGQVLRLILQGIRNRY